MRVISGRPFISVVVLVLSAIPSLARADTSLDASTVVIRNIDIRRMNIFDEKSTAEHRIPRLINRFHSTTRESVIRREIWFSKGDQLSAGDLAELERNIRNLDLFAQVVVTVDTITEDTGVDVPTVDILISTADRLSIVASTGGSFLGGVGEVATTVGEKNLFGLAHSIEFSFSKNTEGEQLGAFGYDNIRFGASDIIAGFRLGQTEEGDFSGFDIRNEFDNSDDLLSWKIEFDQVDTRIDYYEQSVSVVEVPRATDTLSLNRIYRRGDLSGFLRYGLLAEYKDAQYAAAIGEQSDSIIIPANSEELFAGGLLGYDVIHSYKKLDYFDTLDYAQDLSFGYGVEGTLGVVQSLNNSREDSKPAASFDSWWRNSVSAYEYVSSRLVTDYVVEPGRSDSWSTFLAGKLYSRRIKQVTLASSLRYSTGSNSTALPIQQSLGENNGLRGYPAREFNGEQSVLLNLESRIDIPVRVLTFSLGAVVFIDSAWVGDRGQDNFFNDAHVSAGFGVRFGSAKLLGSNVFRVDVAYPFDDDSERDYKPLVSLSLGQVFRFN